MTIPNTLGWDSTKWLSDSNAIPKTLWRFTGTGSTPSSSDISLHEYSASSLTGVDYDVPSSRVFDLLYGQYNSNATTDIGLGIQSNQVADAVDGSLLWSMYLEGGSLSHYNMMDWKYGGGLHFVAGDYVTPYDMGGSGRLQWTFWGWGVESDA